MRRVVTLLSLVVCSAAFAVALPSGTALGDPVALALSNSAPGGLKAFPGAIGFGANAVGGRGGQVVKVTNLNDSGTGSLRWAVSNRATDYNGVAVGTDPRIVVFEVAGPIVLASMLRINIPFLTIAGQTAPSPGIMLRNYGVSITTHDIVMQHLALRLGDAGAGPYDILDGLQIINPSYHIIVDHCSVSWAIDENADTFSDVKDGTNVHDVTLSNNFLTEGLRTSLHSDVNHSKGFHANRRNTNISLVANLFAHNESRNPMLYGGTEIAIVNNIFYNGGGNSFTSISNPYITAGDGPPKASIVGNVYLEGPSTVAGFPTSVAIKLSSSCDTGTEVYQTDNYFPGHQVVAGETQWLMGSPPVAMDDVTILSGLSEIVAHVTSNAGSRPAERDVADARIVSDVTHGTGTWVDSQLSRITYQWRNYKCLLDHTTIPADQILPTDPLYWQDLGPGTGFLEWEDNHTYLAGYPTYAANTQPFAVPSNYNEVTASGYTVIEELLAQAAAAVEGREFVVLLAQDRR